MNKLSWPTYNVAERCKNKKNNHAFIEDLILNNYFIHDFPMSVTANSLEGATGNIFLRSRVIGQFLISTYKSRTNIQTDDGDFLSL